MKFCQIISLVGILTLAFVCVYPAAAATTDEATNYYNLAEQSISTGDKATALNFFNLALASNTTSLAQGDGLKYLYKDKTAVLTDLGQYDEAIQTADAGLALYPKDPGLWNNKGYAYDKMGRYNDAISAYEKAVQLDPSYQKGWINKANALMNAGRAGEAASAYNKVLELDPGNSEATTGLADAQKAANTSLIVIAIVAVIAVGLIILYVRFRKSGDEAAAKKAKDRK